MSTQQIIESWENGVEPYNAKEFECVFIPSENVLQCYQCGKTAEEHNGKDNLFTVSSA